MSVNSHEKDGLLHGYKYTGDSSTVMDAKAGKPIRGASHSVCGKAHWRASHSVSGVGRGR